MTTLHSLLAECERWVGVEPLGNDQWLEVAELRERVSKALATTEQGERRLSLMVESASFLADVAARRSADGIE